MPSKKPTKLDHNQFKDTQVLEIPGFPDYFADRGGSIYSNRRGYLKLMTSFSDDRGYLLVSINGKNRYVHRLVALTFLPQLDDSSKRVVNHKNGNKSDPRIENLEWVTHSRNTEHAVENGFFSNCLAHLADHMRALRRAGWTYYWIARHLGVCPETVRKYCVGKRSRLPQE